jgi:hypothetical protein
MFRDTINERIGKITKINWKDKEILFSDIPQELEK